MIAERYRQDLERIVTRLDEEACGRCGSAKNANTTKQMLGIEAVRDCDRMIQDVAHWAEVARGMGRTDVVESLTSVINEIEAAKLKIGKDVFGLDPSALTS